MLFGLPKKTKIGDKNKVSCGHIFFFSSNTKNIFFYGTVRTHLDWRDVQEKFFVGFF
jgi:hypothetical protein